MEDGTPLASCAAHGQAVRVPIAQLRPIPGDINGVCVRWNHRDNRHRPRFIVRARFAGGTKQEQDGKARFPVGAKKRCGHEIGINVATLPMLLNRMKMPREHVQDYAAAKPGRYQNPIINATTPNPAQEIAERLWLARASINAV